MFYVSGANPNRHDHGRRLCAEEWARFCGRHNCADAISKYIRSKKYFFKKTFVLSNLREKWSSEPDLAEASRKSRNTDKSRSNWIGRHLSMKRKKRPGMEERDITAPLGEAARSSSSPLLIMTPPEDDDNSPTATPKPMRRPSCIDGVVPLAICRPRRNQPKPEEEGIEELCEDTTPCREPPKILETDFDQEAQSKP